MTALSVGRANDLARVLALHESGSVAPEAVCRHAERQQSRRSLSWPEKIRMAAAVRAAVAKLRDRAWRAPETGATGRSRRDEKGRNQGLSAGTVDPAPAEQFLAPLPKV